MIMKKKINNLFTWHLFPQPKDVPIQSVYEICFFGLIFGICVYIYSKCNEIPYCQETIHIECLDNKNPGDKYGNNYLYPEAYINLRMPCTSVAELRTNTSISLNGEKNKDNYLSVQFSYRIFWKEWKNIEPNMSQATIDEEQKLKEGYNRVNRLADSLLSNENPPQTENFRSLQNSLYSNYSILSNRNYREKCGITLNNLNEKYNLFKSLHTSFALPESATTPLYYYKFEQAIRKKYYNKYARVISHFNNSEQWRKVFCRDTILFLQKTEYRKSDIRQEGFIVGTTAPKTTIYDPYEIAIGDPGWFSFEDISQAYYHFSIISETIDSIQLRINFVGSTEFSELVPEPDEITMSSIVYSNGEKIAKIKKDGLLFHVKFTELENRQTVRMFFLTAVMSGLFTIFIGFIVLAIYKMATRKSTSKLSHSETFTQNEHGMPSISENGCNLE